MINYERDLLGLFDRISGNNNIDLMGSTFDYRVPSIFEVVIITDTETKSIYGIIHVLTGFNGGYFPDTSNISNVNQSTTKFHIKKLKNKFTNTSTMKSKFFKVKIESSSQSQLETDISTMLGLASDGGSGYNININEGTYTIDDENEDLGFVCSNYASPFALSSAYDDTYDYLNVLSTTKHIAVIQFTPTLLNRFKTSVDGYSIDTATLTVYDWSGDATPKMRFTGVDIDNIDLTEVELGTTTLTTTTAYTDDTDMNIVQFASRDIDITSVIDEISSRSGYECENLAVLIYDVKTGSAYRFGNYDSEEGENRTYISSLFLSISFPSDYPFWINIIQTAESNSPNQFWAEFEIEARWAL